MVLMDFLYLFIGLILGGLGIFFYAKNKFLQQKEEPNWQENFVRKEIHEQLKNLNNELKSILSANDEELKKLHSALAAAKQKSEMQEERMTELKKESQEQAEQLKADFKVLAQEILDHNSKKFTEQNRTQIDVILNPFKEKLQNFEKKVEETYEKGQAERISLKTEVKSLIQMNEKLSTEANNLTKALKGDVKTQGNWGEVILERILEKSGLVKDREYYIQNSIISEEDGKRYQPDVVIHLPDNKRVIIDSKVSLVAYERYSSEQDTENQSNHLKDHLLSVKQHVKGLSGKNYQSLYGLDGLDFVLMFIPIEGAFSAALQADNGLFQEAFDKNVVIVSTSTLLATLRTIESIWKQEYQNQNALEIARQGGNLYDKFVGFTEDLIKLGTQLNTTKKTYEESMNKLHDGKGNLINRAEALKKLGIKASKKINPKLVERADNENESK